MKINLDTVTLRRPEPKDADYLYKYRNDEEVIQGLGGFSSGYAMKDIQEWIEIHRNKQDEIVWAISSQDSDTCLGHVGFYNIDHRVRTAEFAIMIGNREWWGKGIGKRVTNAVVDYGFKNLNFHRVYLSVLNTNERAINLYKKMGFTMEGILRDGQFKNGCYIDVCIMSVLENEWVT